MKRKHIREIRIVPRAACFVAAAALLGLAACTEPDLASVEFDPFAEATLRFAQSDSTPLRAFVPRDLKAQTADVAWIADPQMGVIFRFEPKLADYRQIGLQDEPPAEIQYPAKIAVSPKYGLFVFDLGSNQVHQFTVDGKHLRAFDPGFAPALIEFARSPLGLTLGLVDREDEENPRLTVIRTDTRGTSPDTLLRAGTHGPPVLWEVRASSAELSLDGSESGFWAFAQAVPDTVFEITDSPGARKRILRPEDRSAIGILADLERGILWVIRPGEEAGELRYSAYDIYEHGTVGFERAFLGERATRDFTPWDAIDGTVMGFTRSAAGLYLVASYDMRVPPVLP